MKFFHLCVKNFWVTAMKTVLRITHNLKAIKAAFVELLFTLYYVAYVIVSI